MPTPRHHRTLTSDTLPTRSTHRLLNCEPTCALDLAQHGQGASGGQHQLRFRRCRNLLSVSISWETALARKPLVFVILPGGEALGGIAAIRARLMQILKSQLCSHILQKIW